MQKSAALRLRFAALLALLTPAGLLACDDSGQECRVGADCASGQCTADGLCLAPSEGTSSSSGSSGTENGSSGSNASSGSSGTSSGGSSGQSSSSSGSSGSSGTPGACIPNNDGTLTRDEVPLAVGVTAKYKFAHNVTVDLRGELVEGVRRWDFSGPLPGDHDVSTTTRAVAGSWFAPSFPTGEVAGLLDDSRNATVPQCPLTVTVPSTLAVLRADPDALSLLGVVSNSDSEPQSSLTRLVYDKAVPTLRFPLTVGSEWSVTDVKAEGSLNGTSVGFPGNTITDAYHSRVVERGLVATPFAVFDVFKVVTTLDRRSTNFCLINTSKTVAFVAECAGTVVKVTSNFDEDNDNFTHAAVVQRLTP